jgi:hypothetical protein
MKSVTPEAIKASILPEYQETPFQAPRCYPTPLTAYLTANRPLEGNHRESWYLYDVEFDGELIVKNSKDAECDAARALLAKGITGKITVVDAKTGKPRTIVNIEKAAKVTVSETQSHGPRFVKWTLNPWGSGA